MSKGIFSHIFGAIFDSQNLGAASKFEKSGDPKDLAVVVRNATLQKQFNEMDAERDAWDREEQARRDSDSLLYDLRRANEEAEEIRNANYKARREALPTELKYLADFNLETESGFQEFLDSMKK